MKNFGIDLLSKYVSNASIVKYACILFLASPVLNSCSTYRVNRLKNKSYKEWKTYQLNEIKRSSDKEVNEWTIYSRKVKGTKFLKYKIEGEIASSPVECVSAFRQDIEHHAADNENKKYPTYNIVNESRDSLLTYVIHNEPFPFKDTEMSIQYLIFSNEDGSMEVRWNEAWDESSIRPSKKLNRVQSFRGSWHFSAVSDNQSKAVNIVQFDPRKMPKWLVNPMVTKFLRKGLENIRQTTSK
jgi:hypothetical protein